MNWKKIGDKWFNAYKSKSVLPKQGRKFSISKGLKASPQAQVTTTQQPVLTRATNTTSRIQLV